MTTQTEPKVTAACPGCHYEIFFAEIPRLGTFVTCPTCGDLIEVISLNPLALDWSAELDDDAWPESEQQADWEFSADDEWDDDLNEDWDEEWDESIDEDEA